MDPDADGHCVAGISQRLGYQGEDTVSNPRSRSRESDSGAALLLAIGFVVLVGAISGGLAFSVSM
jgi:hypothetical protein